MFFNYFDLLHLFEIYNEKKIRRINGEVYLLWNSKGNLMKWIIQKWCIRETKILLKVDELATIIWNKK